ncbi:DNA polymerase lambda-like isoform X2 [Limulus polyphemus]|uniref:DNA polymerase lambda n=1 Tax=Limulus polyphemus TaxID=6850 RepID=A0ABM1SVB0_LIMPO|nr:DNA polymerase lambda-like isoform X2 [Limulus polyphemus]
MEKSSTATTCTKKDESCNKTRTRNTETTSSNEETMFFRDVKAFIIPSGIGHKRLELFQKQLTKYGGNVEQTLTEMTTHIIVDESIEWLKICKILKGNEIFSTLTKVGQTDKWVCARSSRQQTTNLNYDITVKLEVLAETYKNTKDQWRALGYQKAISALKNHHKKITTWEEARSLPGIGTQLADKIWEIIQSGHLRKIDEVCCSERNSAIGLFTKVWGAGPSTAELWVQQGFRTLKDLKTKAKLSRQQQIGLKYFDEIQDRMSREEAGEIFNTVQESAWLVQPELECIACGSYRRGKSNCGDLDVLITHPDGKSHVGVLPKIVALLHSTGFLTDDLVSCVETGNQKKYMGICKLSGVNKKHRRLDIIVAPKSEFACALLYFTGSAHFNRSMRLLARRKGMALSESSLREGVIRKGQEHIMEGYPLPTLTEESIFDYLGLEYRAPEERDH